MNNTNALALIKIEDFTNFSPGWCYGDGVKFSIDIINLAKQLAIEFLSNGFDNIDAFPGVNGEIRVTAYAKDYYLEFTVETECNVTFLSEKNDQEVDYEEGLSIRDCFDRIAKYRFLCDLYEQFTDSTSIKTEVASKLSHSNHLPMEAYQPLTTNARWSPLATFVGTSINITKMSAELQRFSGALRQPYFRVTYQSARL